jgi:hypothetical protein
MIKKEVFKIDKKAQVQGQVLMMILTLLIISFIVIFGGRIVAGVTKQSSQINYIKFKTTLQNDVNAITQEYRSKKEIDMLLPDEFTELCIIDLQKNPPANFEKTYPIIYNYWNDFSGTTSKVTKNVFMVAKQAEASFFVDKVTIPGDGYLCIKEKRSKINFWAEGMGNKAQLSLE